MTEQKTDAIDRIIQLTGAKSMRQLAKILGLKNHASLSQARKRNRIPERWLLTLEMVYGANRNWILYGDDQKSFYSSNEQTVSKISILNKFAKIELNTDNTLTGVVFSTISKSAPISIQEYITPPKKQACLIANQLPHDSKSPIPPALPKEWFRDTSKINIFCLEMTGSDMEPEIADQDFVVVDSTETTPFHGQIYCIAYINSVFVRRFAGDRQVWQGDNPKAQDIPADKSEVLGKVIAVTRRY